MLLNVIAALLGLIFVTLAKISSVKKDFKVANQSFVLKKFFEDEITAIGMSVTVIILMAITVNEWVHIRQGAADYVRIIFALGGAIGSWAFLLILGKSRKYIRNIVDKKTNIADGISND